MTRAAKQHPWREPRSSIRGASCVEPSLTMSTRFLATPHRRRVDPAVVSHARSRSPPDRRELSQAVGTPPLALQLSEEEFCQSELLTHPGFRGVVNTRDLRIMVRRTLASRGVTDQAACIAAAAARLVSLKIIYEVAEGAQPRRGPRMQRFAKRSWSEIQSNTVSMQHLERLGVGPDAFR